MNSWLIVALQPAVVALVQLAVTAAALRVAQRARQRERALAEQLRRLERRSDVNRHSELSSNTPRRISRHDPRASGPYRGVRRAPPSKD